MAKIDEWDASKEIAQAIHDERHDFKWEGWGGMVFDCDGNIVDAKIDKDNNMVIIVQFEEPCDHEQGWFELVLKPLEWRRSIPEKGKRKSRAKDVRADNRSRSRKHR